ncbi:MAG: polysaccharide deacetylase family protein [Sedimentisphaerales bacterium]
MNSSYEIGKWSGFRTAAVTYTFDDGSMPGLYNTAIPMFNEPNFNYKLTAYPVINWCGSYWSNLIAAAAVGHEVGDHSVTHDGSWCSWTASQQGAEYASSQSTINANIPGNQCITVAYPYCCTADYSTPATYFIAARICGGTVNPGTPSNFYAIDSIILGNQGINTTAGITQKDDQAASGGGWVVYLIHALDSDSGYSPLSSTILRESLNYLAAHRSTFWVSTFSNVVRYIKERDSALVFETSNTGDIISVLVTDTLDNTIYNYPITIRRPLPTGWTSAVVKQNGSEVNSSIVTIGPTQYVMFDVVPDGGDVMLTRAYGDFDTSGAVNLTDLDSFFDVWLNMDCGATTGIDLDGDCTVDFYEFAVFANNWLTVQ